MHHITGMNASQNRNGCIKYPHAPDFIQERCRRTDKVDPRCACMYVCVYACACMYVCVCMYVYVRVFVGERERERVCVCAIAREEGVRKAVRAPEVEVNTNLRPSACSRPLKWRVISSGVSLPSPSSSIIANT